MEDEIRAIVRLSQKTVNRVIWLGILLVLNFVLDILR